LLEDDEKMPPENAKSLDEDEKSNTKVNGLAEMGSSMARHQFRKLTMREISLALAGSSAHT
jgi:hypothetical protein